jgi:hypothetical protein
MRGFGSNKADVGSFKHKTSQLTGGISSGVDVDPVRADVRLINRGMAVDDHFIEIVLVEEKVFAYP